ncbi:uncharacterized protein [Arachis hypogaea]|uniref:uncharacterized protein n=1 Tax=Arachis hypogaea TaxID=3818 RepID=UPI000DED33C4
MSMVQRFVDKHDCVQERFFDLIHVSDTCSLTLKTEISSVLSRHNLNVQNLRKQGYDGTTKEVCYVHQFFSKLTLIVNVVTVSPKRHDQLRVAQANNVANLIVDNQLVVLEKSTEEDNSPTRGDANAAYDAITSFEFLQELNERFNDNMVELLILSLTLNYRDNYKFFSANKACELVERFCPGDFSD